MRAAAKKMRFAPLAFGLVLFCAPVFGGGAFWVDVPRLAGTDQTDVPLLLGPILYCFQKNSGQTCLFIKNEMELVFENRRVSRIFIGDMADAVFDKASLARLNLPVMEPVFVNSRVMKWEGLDGRFDVVFYSDKNRRDKISHAVIHVFGR